MVNKKAISLGEEHIFKKEEEDTNVDDSEISDLIKISELIEETLFEEIPIEETIEEGKLPPRVQRIIEGVVDDVIYQATKSFKRRLREDINHALNTELARYFSQK